MEELHRQDEYDRRLNPEGGLQSSLCSNNVLSCSSPSGFFDSNLISEEDALDYLAEVYVDIYFDYIKKQK